MFHEGSFETESFESGSWLFGVASAAAKRLRQTFIALAATYTFVTQPPAETVVKRG